MGIKFKIQEEPKEQQITFDDLGVGDYFTWLSVSKAVHRKIDADTYTASTGSGEFFLCRNAHYQRSWTVIKLEPVDPDIVIYFKPVEG